MAFLILSFVAGVLTILAPCILPLLPVVIGASASGRSKRTPYIVVGSLAISIILFTYLLKVSTAFIMIPPEVWAYISGGILVFFGLTLVFPAIWEKIPGLAMISSKSNKALGAGSQKKSFWGDVIIGAALGPVFSTCSPTYFVILASVLPASFALGTLYLLAYTLGLSIVLLLIALLGERFTSNLSGFADPKNKWKRAIGVLFVILGIMIFTGYEKKLETSIINSGYLDITKTENALLEKIESSDITKGNNKTGVILNNDVNNSEDTMVNDEKAGNVIDSTATNSIKNNQIKKMNETPYIEIANPAGFVNTDGKTIRIADYIGKKVILLDFMTYSCINCQRTFPYLMAWYEKYQKDGLIIIGIHTPEFAFEKLQKNVEEAMQRFGLDFPIVLDNNYGTWNAYGNRYWPRKYLIDIFGNIVYDHIGEGGYEESEMKIRELLDERAKVLGENMASTASKDLVATAIPKTSIFAQSPETYFGSMRNEYLGNGTPGKRGEQDFTAPLAPKANTLYFSGTWNIDAESAQSVKNSKVIYRYNAGNVYIVASSVEKAELEIYQDGKLISTSAGTDVGEDGILTVEESRLYELVHNEKPGEHTLEIRVKKSGVYLYAFTFG